MKYFSRFLLFFQLFFFKIEAAKKCNTRINERLSEYNNLPAPVPSERLSEYNNPTSSRPTERLSEYNNSTSSRPSERLLEYNDPPTPVPSKPTFSFEPKKPVSKPAGLDLPGPEVNQKTEQGACFGKYVYIVY